MHRKFLLPALITALAGFAWPTAFAQAQGAAPDTLRSIVVLEFELVDEQNNPLTKAAQEVRLRRATLQLRQVLAERRLYSVADQAASQTLQDHLRSQQAFFYRCDDCAAQVGKLLDVELVMTPWVQKVSELILNLNVQIYDVHPSSASRWTCAATPTSPGGGRFFTWCATWPKNVRCIRATGNKPGLKRQPGCRSFVGFFRRQ